ncbi:HAMP domain-containing sensor histidine kinase [Streptomyces ferralitis]|uniref:histidine kinase n=1 Tax=Streptantibioticus ferralitis TaxID=236510 RepID=A0ABT5Z667_9ACTN|nr:HAMP domain-containing sensor histidine kinase [Streptantibioticus ferralitis]MDF2259332.1 HAMP domain-containing sensor histidine kinase [Streptantibioticus ferralitis]
MRLLRRWRFKALSLRSRLALLVAAAVAVAVAAVAVAAWFITRGQLMHQFELSLVRSPHLSAKDVLNARLECSSNDQIGGPGSPGPPQYSSQVVLPDGRACVLPGSKAIKVEKWDAAVASGAVKAAPLHTSKTTSDNQKVLVYTRIMFVPQPGGFGLKEPVAVSTSRSLDEVVTPLDSLAFILVFVAGIGVIGAASAGFGIARAGLRPVDRLTDAVEHIARTEDLAVRIPVDGEDEIARLSASFNSMTAQLASSRERQQQLIADAGHELRTPLTSLRTNIELLTRSEETGRPLPAEDRKALLASVKAQMTELALLIGDLQELSRPDAIPGSGLAEAVGLHEVTAHAVQRARLRGPDLAINAHLAPWYVRAEPASLERAIVNLLDNAVKFSPSGGTIEVILVNGELSVRDQGPGIPPEDLPHVFERFWRSPSARALPGSGLGLSIVARTIQQAGGAVALQPAPGGGTVAVVRLPGAAIAPLE